MLAALVAVTAQVDAAEVLLVVNLPSEITHPGLEVAKLTTPVPDPPEVVNPKLDPIIFVKELLVTISSA
jgi:hypothetical protein